MTIPESRRDFAAYVVAGRCRRPARRRPALADEGPPETTRVRLLKDPGICVAPIYVAEELLRAEGFTDVRYVQVEAGNTDAEMVADGKLDFSHMLSRRRPSADRRRQAAHGAGRGASRLLRAVRPRAHPKHQRSERQARRHPKSSAPPARATWRSWQRMSGSTRPRTSTGSRAPRSTPCRCSPKARPTRSSASRPSRRSCARARFGRVDPQHRHGPAVVAIFLLHARRQHGLCPQLSGGHQARRPCDPQGRGHLRHRAGAGGADAWSMAGSTRALRLRAADARRSAVRQVARLRPEDTCATTRCGSTRSA